MFPETARGQQAWRTGSSAPYLSVCWLLVEQAASSVVSVKQSPLYLIVVQAWSSKPSAATHTHPHTRTHTLPVCVSLSH